MKKEYMCFRPWVCKRLLQRGYRIIDVRPHHEIRNASAFVFADETIKGVHVADAIREIIGSDRFKAHAPV